MNAPTPEQIAKLPKWAQDRMAALERQREESVCQLNKMTDDQTPAPIFYDDLIGTGEQRGPSFKRRYFQGRGITIQHRGVEVRIHLSDGDTSRDVGIHISYEAINRRLVGRVALIPTSFQQLALVPIKTDAIRK